MRPNDYERLLTQFVADGRDVNATNPEGQRIHDVIAEYPRQSGGFLEAFGCLLNRISGGVVFLPARLNKTDEKSAR